MHSLRDIRDGQKLLLVLLGVQLVISRLGGAWAGVSMIAPRGDGASMEAPGSVLKGEGPAQHAGPTSTLEEALAWSASTFSSLVCTKRVDLSEPLLFGVSFPLLLKVVIEDS